MTKQEGKSFMRQFAMTSVSESLTSQRHHDRLIAVEYAAEYARGHEQAAMWIWWAMLCGQPPDMVPYQDRPGNDPVWLRDVDAPPCNGTLARELEPVDWRWITRENAQRTIERDAEKARARAEWEARRAAQS